MFGGSFREHRKFLLIKFGDGLELSHFGMFEVKFREKFVKKFWIPSNFVTDFKVFFKAELSEFWKFKG